MPDTLAADVSNVQRWLGLGSPGWPDAQRLMVQHYRAGLIPRWAGGILTQPRAASASAAPAQMLWSSLWRQLAWAGAQERIRELGRAGFERWCAASPVSAAPASRPSTLLLLGGDATATRTAIVKRLYEDGSLDGARRTCWGRDGGQRQTSPCPHLATSPAHHLATAAPPHQATASLHHRITSSPHCHPLVSSRRHLATASLHHLLISSLHRLRLPPFWPHLITSSAPVVSPRASPRRTRRPVEPSNASRV
jgi:hypothetical protein